VGVGMVFGMSLFCHLRILRPQILGELAFAGLLLVLSRPVLSRRALFFVPLAMVLWVHCHASFPIGFVLLGTALAGLVIAVAGDSPSPVALEPNPLHSVPGAVARRLWVADIGSCPGAGVVDHGGCLGRAAPSASAGSSLLACFS